MLYALSAATVVDDGALDNLSGNQGQDWFWAIGVEEEPGHGAECPRPQDARLSEENLAELQPRLERQEVSRRIGVHGAMVEEEGDGVAREHEGSRLVDPETVLDAGTPEPERQEGRGEEQEPEDGSAAARRRSHVRRPPSPGLKILTTHVPLRFVIAVSSSSG